MLCSPKSETKFNFSLKQNFLQISTSGGTKTILIILFKYLRQKFVRKPLKSFILNAIPSNVFNNSKEKHPS